MASDAWSGFRGKGSWLRAIVLGVAASSSLLLHTPHVPGGDVQTYLAAGRLEREGRPEAVYDYESLVRAHQRGGGEGRLGAFWSSPLWLPLAGILAELPTPSAVRLNQLWLVAANALGLAFLLRLLAHPGWEVATAVSFALAHPVRAGLAFGNWGAFLFALLGVATWSLGRGSKLAGALGAGLAIHVKLWAIFGPLALIRLRNQWTWLVSIVAGGLLATVIGVVSFGIEAWQAWFKTLQAYGERGVTPYYNKVSLAACLARLASDPRAWLAPPEPLLPELTHAIGVLGLGATLALGLARRWSSPLTRWAAGCVLSLLAVPTIWDHGYVLLFLAVPALSALGRGLLLLAFGASFGYPYAAAWLLEGALKGSTPPLAAATFLAFYPLLGLLTLWGLLRQPDRHEKVWSRASWRALFAGSTILIGLACLSGFAWLTRNPEHPLLDRMVERFPPLAAPLRAFRSRWGVPPELVGPEGLLVQGAPSELQRSREPVSADSPREQPNSPPPPKIGSAQIGKETDAASVELLIVSPAPRPIDPALRELVERSTGRILEKRGLGPYDLLVAEGAELPRVRWERLVSTLDPTYSQRFGVTPSGTPAEAVLLFSERDQFEAVVRQIEPSLDPSRLQGIATRGAALIPVGNRSVEEVEASLIHELVHLINRRVFGRPLPLGLEEGLAEALALVRFDLHQGFLWGELRESRVPQDGGIALGGGVASLLELGAAFDRGAVPALEDRWGENASGWFEAEPELARAAAGFWVTFLLKEEDGPLGMAFRRFLRRVAEGGPVSGAVLLEDLARDPAELEAAWRGWIQNERDRYRSRLRLEGLELPVVIRGSSVRQRPVPSA